ncbi:LOW QUALITY PROTEIN: paraneoplastic antigen Ma3 homolog [Amphiura filiformis]|uniref:LOW QUALITY PROTEIN: paraneoplastic antigen Ma3 homolog n=1 Tax=Amphiura filiformis TaxID=82378 RepID=UPI003B226E1D
MSMEGENVQDQEGLVAEGEDVPPPPAVDEIDEDEDHESYEEAQDNQPSSSQQTPDFKAALQALLLQHGKTLDDVTTPKVVNDVIVKHVVDTTPMHLTRRLRQFSGKQPVPNGEAEYATWRQSAKQLIQEKEVKEVEKKKRIKQSLIGQAGDLVLVLEKESAKNGKVVTPDDYVAVVDKMFGVCFDGDDLYSEFRALYQQQHGPGDYLVRLHTKLDTVIEHGGADEWQRDRLLLAQFIRGCLYDEYLLQKLQLEQKKTNPPDFITFLHDVRMTAARYRERQNRKQQGSQRTIKPSRADVMSNLPPRITQLEDQLQKLSTLVHDMVTNMATNMATTNMASHNHPTRPRPARQQQPRRPFICYNCAEEGHRIADCPNPRNADLVQQF